MVDGESFEVQHFFYSQNYKFVKNSFSVHKLDAQEMSYHISKTYSNVPVTFKKNKAGGDTGGYLCAFSPLK